VTNAEDSTGLVALGVLVGAVDGLLDSVKENVVLKVHFGEDGTANMVFLLQARTVQDLRFAAFRW
jgi:hypothetical protein